MIARIKMRYFTNSIRNYISQKIENAPIGNSFGRRIMIMIPMLPEKNLLSVADAIESYCLSRQDVSLTLKIAQVLTDEWSERGRQVVAERDWLDIRGNLTYYRNLSINSVRLPVVVLCGSDCVTDSAGLADFHTCGLDTVWESEMKRSFQGWVADKLESIGILVTEREELKTFDKILKPLIDHGIGDLLQISEWLDVIDVKNAGCIQDVQRVMLTHLDYFGLPSFVGFPLKHRNKTIAAYIDKAVAFFNYTLFLESRERDKAQKSIVKINDAIQDGVIPSFLVSDEEAVCGQYNNGQDMLDGLERYIASENKDDREKLLSCDFITIFDKILKYRKKEIREKKRGLKKLTGSPVETILTAIWLTLRDLCKERVVDSCSQITKIEIKYDIFKHDIEEVDDEGCESCLDTAELACQYLSRLIGGVDTIIEKYLYLEYSKEQPIEVECTLLEQDRSIPCRYSRSAEPSFEFSVYIHSNNQEKAFRGRFAWRLPENHSYRLSESLLNITQKALEVSGETWKLPVFHFPYYEEMFMASSECEVRDTLLHCIRETHIEQSFLTNLLSGDWLDSKDSLIEELKKLAQKYHCFIRSAVKKGLLGALFSGSEWAELLSSYTEGCDLAAKRPEYIHSPAVGMLMRSFLIIRGRFNSDVAWHGEDYEQSGVVTVLHPSIMEMLQAQVVYLTSCFNYAVNKELKSDLLRKMFNAGIWQNYIDISQIQMPILGLLCNEEQNLDTNIRGEDLIHRVGISVSENATLSTRVMLRYSDGMDDEEFTDVEMFRDTNESKLLQHLMLDYLCLHPHARDGISLAVFRNENIQPVITAVDRYLMELADPNSKCYILNQSRKRPYSINVTFFTESSDDTDVLRWIEQWQQRWEAAEVENSKYQHYKACHFSVAHRLVDKVVDGSFIRLLNDNFDADIAVFYDFIGAGSGVNDFKNVPEFDITTRTLKFPILEKACCAIINPLDKYRRTRIISNRQFMIGSHHAKLMHCLKTKNQQEGTIVIGIGDFKPWQNIIDLVHTKAEWVICIDPNMDERLIKDVSTKSGKEREIIGFGSGVGTNGGDNYTISTEQFSLSDIKARLFASIESLYAQAGWSLNDCDKIVTGILEQACKLSGLSLVRATGVCDQYIHDFMAYALSRKMLRSSEDVLCDNLISLDAYRHWFDTEYDRKRPDLMWLVAKIGNDGRLHIDVRLIECKMANKSDTLLLKARSQVNNGLKILVPAFEPIPADGNGNIEDLRPDRRHWWMQLHRLIASKAEIQKADYSSMLSAMERLAEGDYKITWGASVFAFWIDSPKDNIENVGQWKVNTPQEISGNIYVMGSQFVSQLAICGTNSGMDWEKLDSTATKNIQNICDNVEDDDFDEMQDEDEIDYPDDLEQSIQRGSIEDITTDSVIDRTPINDSIIDIRLDNLEGSNRSQILNSSDQFQVESADKMPQRIFLGTTLADNKQIYWEFGHSELANRHMLIFGSSGMGKTYAIQCILCEMAAVQQNSLIVDYTNGFLPNQLETTTNSILKPEQHVVKNLPLPINPFLPQSSNNGGIILEENANSVAKRIAGIFNTVYQIGDQQFSVLHKAIMEGVETNKTNMNFDTLLEILDRYTDIKKFKNPAQTLHSKINPFVLDKPFAHGQDGLNWDSIFTDNKNRCNVFQLTGLDMHSTRLVTEFVLWDLYGYLQSKGKKTDPKVIVLDEVQNLDHQEGSPLSKYLREGRKFGVSLILATQTMSNMRKDERDRMFNAGHKLFFKPADTELKAFAEIAAISVRQKPEDWVNKLANLRKGECYSIGQSLNLLTGNTTILAQKIKITPLEERLINVKKD